MNRKRIVITGSIVLGIALFAAVLLYRPKRTVTIEVEGPPEGSYRAVFVVDGDRQTQTVTLPKTFTFYARDVSYRVDPVDKEAGGEIKGRISTDDGFADGSSSGWGVGGRVGCANALGVWSGGLVIASYTKDSPGPEVTTR